MRFCTVIALSKHQQNDNVISFKLVIFYFVIGIILENTIIITRKKKSANKQVALTLLQRFGWAVILTAFTFFVMPNWFYLLH